MNDSLLALQESVDIGHIDLDAADGGDPDADPVATLRGRACRLLGACTSAEGHDEVSVAGMPLTTGIVTSTGAIDIAVHGWDVARTCVRHRPIPAPLAEELLELTPLLVGDADQPARFAAPVDVSPVADPGERLIAFLGRPPTCMQ